LVSASGSDLVTRRARWLLAITALAVAGACLVVAGARARAPAHPPAPAALYVQPFPDTPDASPNTNIGFPALAPGQISALTVTGSRSGPHRGRLIAVPSGHGSAWVSQRPFTDGERVWVRATLSSPAAGTATGAPGAIHIRFSFSVAAPVATAATAAMPVAGTSPPPVLAHSAGGFTHTFHSENWLHPPIASVHGRVPDPGAGDIFTDAENSVQSGPLIFSPQGQLIYFQPIHHSAAFNLQVQQYQGQSVLTYWQGYQAQGIGVGHGLILNHHYQRVATVSAGHGYRADLHEFQITRQGDALITAFVPVRANLSLIGEPRGTLIDSVIQKVNIATGRVVWEWHAYGHVALQDSYWRPPHGGPWDFFHLNSVQQLPNGNLLISSRYTWSLYEISGRTGRIVLVIGGKRSSFRMGPGTNFEWQHDARMQSGGTITLFDNASDGFTTNESHSRALRIRLDYKHRRATLVHAYTNNPRVLSASQGSVQPLGDGNTFVGWGSSPWFSEFGFHGAQRFSMRFYGPLEAYRGYRFQWWGQPATPPSIAATASGQGTRVYASWDGATDVSSWRVLAGPNGRALSAVGQFPMTSFETTMPVASSQPYFAVQALGNGGQVLATSGVVAR
jgi:hypothetical protein